MRKRSEIRGCIFWKTVNAIVIPYQTWSQWRPLGQHGRLRNHRQEKGNQSDVPGRDGDNGEIEYYFYNWKSRKAGHRNDGRFYD